MPAIANYTHAAETQGQQPDTKPGAYFVSVVDGQRVGLLLGPFVDNHAAALARVDMVRAKAEEMDSRAVFYAFGTVRLDADHPRAEKHGILNSHFGM
ncbi:hypothetical protein [Azohydromonas aeria]|uniref:hypothetical protein n=1 Tax=Azohydromonas aeria TaxID=2590212 RepID=UPI0012FAE204|nr:hypothetical protein [Azohydromonas aeria]